MNLRHLSVLVTAIVFLPGQAVSRFFVPRIYTPRISMPELSIPRIPDIHVPTMHEFNIPKIHDYNFPNVHDVSFPKFHDYSFPKVQDVSVPKTEEFSNGVRNVHPEHPKIDVKQYDIMKTMMKEEELNKVLDTEGNNKLTSKKDPTSPKHEEELIYKSKQEYSTNKKIEFKDIEEEVIDLAEDVLDMIDALTADDGDEGVTGESSDKSDSEDWDQPSISFGGKNKKRLHKRKNNRLCKRIKKVSEAFEDLFKDDSDEHNNSTLSTEGNHLFDGNSVENGTEVSTTEPISIDCGEAAIKFTKKHKNRGNKSGYKRKNKHLGKKIKNLSKAIDDLIEDNDSKKQNNSAMSIDDHASAIFHLLENNGTEKLNKSTMMSIHDHFSAMQYLHEKNNSEEKYKQCVLKNTKHLCKKIQKVTEAMEKLLENIDSLEARSTGNICDCSIGLPFYLFLLVLYNHYKITMG